MILDYLSQYFNKEKILKANNFFRIFINNEEYVNVKKDNLLGWHCFGFVKNIKKANKIEYDLETFLDEINTGEYLYL